MTARVLELRHPNAGLRLVRPPAPEPAPATPAGPAAGRKRAAVPGRGWTPALVGAAALLSLASFAVFLHLQGLAPAEAAESEVRRVLYVDSVTSIPAWFTTLVLAACAQALWRVGSAARAAVAGWSPLWRALSAAFALLSLDELTALHVPASAAVRGAIAAGGPSLTSPGVVLAGVAGIAALAVVTLRFLAALPAGTRWAIVGSGLLYATGAVVLDHLGSGALEAFGAADLRFGLLTAVEEGLEMVGPVLLLGAVSNHAAALRDPAAGAMPAAVALRAVPPSPAG
jgi:hypothetical protein